MPIPEHRAKFAMWMGKIPPGTRIEMEVTAERSIRSVEQNNYYHGVIVQILSDHTGIDTVNMHEVLKYLHNSKEITLPDGEVIRQGQTTTKLDTKEATEYFERIRLWAQQELNCIIPLPNETT